MRTEEIRWDNLTKLLDQLFIHKRRLRSELARDIRVRKSTMSYLIDELHGLNMIRIKKIVSQSRGRPNEEVSLNPDHGHVFGIKLGRESLKAVVYNFSLEHIDSREYLIRHFPEYANPVERALHSTEVFFRHYKPVAVGIAISGSVDIKRSTVNFSPILGLSNYDLRPFLQKQGVSDTFLCNDVDALHVGEIIKAGVLRDSSLAISFGVGVGASFYDGVDIMTGSDGRTSFEFGHFGAVKNGEKCYCGRKGCLETVASEYGLMKKTAGSIPHFVENFERFFPYLNQIRDNAASGRIVEEYDSVLDYLSYHVSSLILLLRPKSVLIGGEGVVAQWIFDRIVEKIESYLSDTWALSPSIRRVTDPETWETGSAFLALRRYVRKKLWRAPREGAVRAL